jgi:hypothetical protein
MLVDTVLIASDEIIIEGTDSKTEAFIADWRAQTTIWTEAIALIELCETAISENGSLY